MTYQPHVGMMASIASATRHPSTSLLIRLNSASTATKPCKTKERQGAPNVSDGNGLLPNNPHVRQ